MMDEEIRQALSEVQEMKKMCGNINMKLTNIVTQRGQDWKKKLEAEYQRGLDDAWEYAKKIVLNPDDDGLGLSELNEIFGFYTIQSIFKNYTVQQAIEKLKAYEKEQKANDEIKVGDEVISRRSERKGILLEPEVGDTFATVIVPSERWRTYCIRQADLTKTGKHYNIEDLLKAMNG